MARRPAPGRDAGAARTGCFSRGRLCSLLLWGSLSNWHQAITCSFTCTRHKAAPRRRVAQTHRPRSGSGLRRASANPGEKAFKQEKAYSSNVVRNSRCRPKLLLCKDLAEECAWRSTATSCQHRSKRDAR